ncbi:hypothetical protein BS50DRAFT_490023 [Corynespora cassiicola Philippines]|uniref:Uncharacterized protein n=1 Tax=Corynespora cassiicola Philippines TaxID=1448308 RepID=A0A2T2NUR8_CORCC|nr:hypothetical protein BS50DRAFT_490023 [Corynespora cassiicola Philippines]
MALPVVLLREFQTNTISNWAPGKLVLTYEVSIRLQCNPQLELLACETLSRNSKEWDVHFHFENGACEGKALPLLWDKGVYFDESCLKEWKLHLFAHFERSEAISTGKQTHSIQDTGTTKSPEDSLSQIDKISPYGSNDIGSSILVPVDHHDQSVQLSATLNIPRKRRPSKVYDLSSISDSDNTLVLREDGNKYENVLEAASSRTPIVLPSPPPEERYRADFLLASTINASEGQFGHRPKQLWDKALYQARTRIAHAKLIHGRYGVIIPKRCESCLERGVACLAYHPRLKGYPHRAESGRCGECRNRSTGCDLSSNPFDGLLLQDSDGQHTEQPADQGICNTEVMLDLMDFKMSELLD